MLGGVDGLMCPLWLLWGLAGLLSGRTPLEYLRQVRLVKTGACS